jgi:hypothetical protein
MAQSKMPLVQGNFFPNEDNMRLGGSLIGWSWIKSGLTRVVEEELAG